MRLVKSHPAPLIFTWAASLGMSLADVELYLQIAGLTIGVIVGILTAVAKWYDIMESQDEKIIRDAEEAEQLRQQNLDEIQL